MNRATSRLASAIAALLLLGSNVASRAEDLPKGEDVLKQYVEATGGKAAYEKVKNRVMKGTLEIPGAGIACGGSGLNVRGVAFQGHGVIAEQGQRWCRGVDHVHRSSSGAFVPSSVLYLVSDEVAPG